MFSQASVCPQRGGGNPEQIPRRRRPLQWAVRILLVCILVAKSERSPSISNPHYLIFQIGGGGRGVGEMQLLNLSWKLIITDHKGKVMFSQVSVCPQSASWLLVHYSALLRRRHHASYWNAFSFGNILLKTAWNFKNLNWGRIPGTPLDPPMLNFSNPITLILYRHPLHIAILNSNMTRKLTHISQYMYKYIVIHLNV